MRIRYRLSSFYMVLSLLISMFALFDGLSVYREYLNGLDAEKECSYPYEVQFTLSGLTDMDREALELFAGLAGYENVNVKITGLYVKSNNSEYSWPLTIALANNIPERIWLTSGERYSADERLETGVLAGRARAKFASEENGGRYLYLENQDRFAVTGEIGLKGSAFQDTMLLMSVKLMPEEWNELFEKAAGVSVWLQSEDDISNDLIKQTTQLLLGCFPNASIEAAWSHAASGRSVVMEYSKLPLFVWLYVFCSVILVQVSVFWVTAHKKEIMVRKICGYGDAGIFLVLLRELLRLVAFSFMIYVCLHVIVTRTALAELAAGIHIQEAEIFVLYLVLTVGIGIAMPTYWIRKWSCGQLLNEKQV